MTELRVCTGLAFVASVALTAGAFAEGGNDIFSAVDIVGIPFSDTGFTCDNTNDGDAVCPFTGSTAPDVWYTWTPSVTIEIDVDLCDSDAYDTKTYILDENLVEIACNDDACGLSGWRSLIQCADLLANVQYFIAVDGYGSACGDYILYIFECEPCVVPCPAEVDLIEGEPPCGDDYNDTFNGGCNSTPPIFQQVECGTVEDPFIICGESGTFLYGTSNYRDTDWFETTTDETFNILWDGIAEFPLLLFIIDGGSGNCDDLVIIGSVTGPPCDPIGLASPASAPGLYWFWAGPSVFDSWPCVLAYVGTLVCEGDEPCEIECVDTEGEGPCFDEYVDNFNGGCNSAGEPFSPIACNEVVCGYTGTYLYQGSNYRDTDWFELAHPGGPIAWEGEAELPFLLFIIDGNAGCAGLVIITSGTGLPCELIALASDEPAGVIWLWAGPSVFSGWPCDAQYICTVTCGDPCTPNPDVNDDGVVDVLDLLDVLAFWGTAGPYADVNCDGIVDVLDLLDVLANWS